MSNQIKNERQTIIYDREKYSSMDIVKLHKQGYDVLCSDCNSKLIFITSLQEARQKDPGHPGIFCPKSNDHVYITFSIGSSEIQKRIKDREAKETEREMLWEKIALMESEIKELKSWQNKSDQRLDKIDAKINS